MLAAVKTEGGYKFSVVTCRSFLTFKTYERLASAFIQRKRTDADELLEQLDHFSLARKFSIPKRTHRRDHWTVRILRWRPAFPLTRRRKNRLELFFEARGHGQAFDDHLCIVARGSGSRSFAFSRLRRRTPGSSAFSESRFDGVHVIARDAGRHGIRTHVIMGAHQA